jgi:hypothetical protein
LHRDLQQQLISSPKPCRGIGRVEKRAGFLTGQELHGAALKPLEGHRQHLLAMSRKSRLVKANVRKESVDGAQTIVATAAAVAAILLKMLEERTHQFGVQVLQVQVAGLAAMVFGSKFEQQSEGVSITGDGVRAGSQLPQQSIGKEPLQMSGQIRGTHFRPP